MIALNNAIYRMRKTRQFPLLNSGYRFPGITFTRNSTRRYFNASGLSVVAAVDEWPVEYDQATLAYKGRSIWESRTNVALHNRDLTNAAWTKSNTTAAKTATGIDGVANSASTLTATAGNGTCLQAITLASSARFQSCWIKRRTGSGQIEMTTDNGTTWTAVTVTASWARVSIPTQTLANPTVGFRIVTSGDAVDIDFVQNENGTFATPEIETAGSAVARAADLAAITSIGSFYNQPQGTFVVAGTSASVANIAQQVFYVSDNSSSEAMFLRRTTLGNLAVAVNDGGVAQADVTGGAVAASASFRCALSYEANNISISVDGAAVVTDSAATIPTVTRIDIGSTFAGAQPFNGWISSLSYHAVALPGQLRTL
jgi:hypothetical protein